MANSRFYSSTALETTLTNSVTPSTLIIQVAATTGFPGSLPYRVALDYGSASMELVEVTGVAGLNLTVTRAIDGTSASSHNAGAAVRHVSSAEDFTDSRTHEAAIGAVHGLTGNIVGTTDTQTLTNKTLTAPTITNPTVTGGGSLAGTFTGSPTFSGAPIFSGVTNHTAAIQSTQSAATNTSFATIVTADTFDRFRILADGDMEWGSGAGARDVQLYRDAADVLATNDTIRTYGAGATTDSFQSRVTGDTVSRLNIDADGTHSWGPGGASAQDTNLFRSAADTLRTDDSLIVGTNLTVTGTAATGNLTVTGTVTGTGTADFGHTETTAGITYATDFAAGSMVFRETAGVKFLDVEVVRSGATFTPANTSGNITPDLTICTIPAGTRPPSALYVCASTGVGDGSLRINADGTCELLTWMADPVTITNGSTIRFTATWID